MTIYCINPYCNKRENDDENDECDNCGTPLVVKGYCLFKPLHTSIADLYRKEFLTEVWELIPHLELYDWSQEERFPKVLKILRQSDEQSIRLFYKEVEVLSFLTQQYPYQNVGIPKVEDSLQEFKINDSQTIYCFLMQKIDGINLEKWSLENGKIDQQTALNWLKELVEILEKIHKLNLIHRDIKPSNIMISNNNQRLILIDFGTVGIKDIASTIVGTYYYNAPEQEKGEALKQSDFYALGRTFVRLLTGLRLNILEESLNKNPYAWREKAPQISEPLADLIDKLMDVKPEKRPQTTQDILIRLEEIQRAIKSDFRQKLWVIRRKIILIFSIKNGILVAIFLTILVALLVVALEFMGALEFLELKTFDLMMNLRPKELLDNRFLIVKITNADIDYQDSLGMNRKSASISDEALERLLKKLNQYQPRVIGLDIYRDFPVESHHDYLQEQFKENRKFIGICKTGSQTSIAPPPEIPKQRLGFVNVPLDLDNIIRRQLLGMSVQPNSSCQTPLSFNLQIALNYLEKEKKRVQRRQGEDLRIDQVVFHQLKHNSGGYNLPKEETEGYQILVNYRASQPIAEEITLQEILDNTLDNQLSFLVKDKIVLIGTDAEEKSFPDSHNTPYGKMQGVVLQANMISQIISAVLDQRKLIQWRSHVYELSWLFAWCFQGGFLAWFMLKRRWSFIKRLVILVSVISILFALCFVSLLKGYWILFYPSFCGFILTTLFTLIIINIVKHQRNKYFYKE